MQLPDALLREQIQKLTGCSILYFKDITHEEGVPPHYHFIIAPADPADFVICLITSKVEKRESYYGRVNKKAAECLVKIDDSTLSFLSKSSVIDCNQAELIRRADLMKRVDHDYDFKIEVRDAEIPEMLKTQVRAAIKNSPLISNYIKKLI